MENITVDISVPQSFTAGTPKPGIFLSHPTAILCVELPFAPEFSFKTCAVSLTS